MAQETHEELRWRLDDAIRSANGAADDAARVISGDVIHAKALTPHEFRSIAAWMKVAARSAERMEKVLRRIEGRSS